MSIQKPLCLICERPTADGAVLAVHVDKEKLQNWFLYVCKYELADEIQDEDKVCYFCIWDAEFLWKFNGMSDEAFVWWPRISDYSDDAAKELRNYYFEGKLDQCWVQLEIIEQPLSDGEERRNVEAETRSRRWTCIYCGKIFKYARNLSQHMKNMHKEAIRCENRNCPTYFHTLEEKEEHAKNVHENSKEREKFKCSFYGKEFEGPSNYKSHVHRVHKEFPVNCSLRGCLTFFKTEIEMKTHFDSAHGIDVKARMFKCNDCDYKAMKKSNLEEHIASKHLPKYIKCRNCEKMYSTEFSLERHINQVHKFKVCRFCKSAVTNDYMKRLHLNVKKCSHCKIKFECRGLYQTHLKSCRKRKFKCDKCSKSYIFKCNLARHMRKIHKQYKWETMNT